MILPRLSLLISLSAAFAVGLGACGSSENKYDVYMKGLQIEGEAERGPCQLTFDGGMRAQTLSGDQVLQCLRRQEEAIAEYERAKAMGMDEDRDFVKTHERALERKQNLESMLKQIRRMERDAARGS
jgi:hypothetical protein